MENCKRITYINGTFVDGNATVPVTDRGFRFGDGIFETIPFYQEKPYRFDSHLKRLKAGLAALRITLEVEALRAPALALIEKNALQKGLLRIAVSRGSGSTGYLPQANIAPTVVIEAMDFPDTPAEPVSLWLSGFEKISPKALPAHKFSQGVNATLARLEAADHNCFDALQLNTAGEICETSSANIFWLKNSTLHTPSLATGALAGITREAIMALSQYPAKEGAHPLSDLQQAQAVVIANSAWNILPVSALHPQGWRWESEALARILNRLLQEDIAR